MTVAPISAAYTGHLRTRAVLAAVLFWLWVPGIAVSVLLVAAILLGDRLTGTPLLSDVEFNLVLSFSTLAVIVTSSALAAALAAWAWRARRNAEVLSSFPFRTSARWALFGWFVPFVNLVVPALVVADIVRAIGLTRPGVIAVRLWWTALLGWPVGWGLSFVAALLGPAAYLVATIAAIVPLVVAAACFTRIALAVAAAQDQHL